VKCPPFLQTQWECGRPVPHIPQERGFPEQDGSAPPSAAPEANTESFFVNFSEPQCGHFVPVQSLERTSTSLSFSHFAQ
jgi:hypothetical protein